MVYRKACHLATEIEIQTHWAMKLLKFDSTTSRDKRKVQLQEHEEMCLNAYVIQALQRKNQEYAPWSIEGPVPLEL